MSKPGFHLALEFRDDALGQHLAQLDTPLIERVDVPDGALGEDTLLVEGDQLAERLGREPIGKNGVRRAVAVENPMGNEPFRCALSFDLLGCFPKASASAWAKTFARSMSWCRPSALSAWPNAMKSQGMSFVPW